MTSFPTSHWKKYEVPPQLFLMEVEEFLFFADLNMKAVVQRVLSGSVRVDGEIVASIGKGFVALIGIHR